MSDMTRIQDRIASIARDEAREAEKIAAASARLGRATSPSSAQSAQRDIERSQREIARLQGKKASESRDLARKQSDLACAQKTLMDEQQREMKKSLDIIRRMESEANSRSDLIASGIRSSLVPAASSSNSVAEQKYTAFISYASEDKDEVARPLAETLRGLGHALWYDEFTLRVGDSLRRTIDRGLASSRFGIVILSPSFFAKNWPQYELDGMVAREVSGQKVILPLWHKVSKNEVIAYSPTLADRVALSTSLYTIEELARHIHAVLSDGASSAVSRA